VEGLVVELPELADRHNLNPLRFSDHFDGPDWRRPAVDRIARAVDAAAGRDAARVGLPAAIGCRVHPEAWRDTIERLGRPAFELPLVPPGIPGIRLYNLLRAELIARGGRLLLGEPIARFDARDGRIVSVSTTAATREVVTRVGGVVLATGGIEGGGLAGDPGGRVVDTVLGMPIDAPPIDRWMAADALDPGGMPIAGVGFATDDELRPLDRVRLADGPIWPNVRIVGRALGGQRWLRERSGDGVAIASAWRAAASLSSGIEAPGVAEPAAHGAPAAGGAR
jgi:glycerol-3-phosphate dehydrogenase subunit B